MLYRVLLVAVLSASMVLLGVGPVAGADAPEAVPPTVGERLDGLPASPAEVLDARPFAGAAPEAESGAESEAAQGADGGIVESTPVATPIPFSMVGFEVPADATAVWFRTSEDGSTWTEWTATEVEQAQDGPEPGSEELAEAAVGRFTEPIWVGAATHLQTRVEGGASTEEVAAHLIDTGGLSRSLVGRAADALAAAWRGTPDQAAAQSAPRVVSRAGWGADESWRKSAPSYASNARAIVVHHTAGTNAYTQAQAPQVVRGIYRYHTQSQGWNDIGYNLLVDRFGTVYEGRYGGLDRAVIGAHAGGYNTGTVGVSLMGQHHTPLRSPAGAAPTSVAMAALTDVIAWKAAMHGIDPSASVTLGSGSSARTVRTILGHRDVGQTSCPGDTVYSQLPALREAVARRVGPNALARIGTAGAVPAASVDISRNAFPERGSASHAVIARADVFADAMAGGPLAGTGGPLLLTGRDALDPQVRSELERVLPADRTVYLLGGTGAIGEAVARELASRWRVERVSGAERTGTAAAVAALVRARSGSQTVMVARAGPDDAAPWADALAGGAYGARAGIPVLLTYTGSLTDQTRQALQGVSRTFVLGGAAAVSDQVLRQLPNATRIAGGDRVGTAVAVAEQLWGRRSGAAGEAVLVGGGFQHSAWTLSLAGSPLAARRSAPLLLTSGTSLSPATRGYLQRLGYGDVRPADGMVLGGTASVGDRVVDELWSLLR